MSDSKFNDERDNPKARSPRTGITRGGGFTIGYRPKAQPAKPQTTAPASPPSPSPPPVTVEPAVPHIEPPTPEQPAKPVEPVSVTAQPEPESPPAPLPPLAKDKNDLKTDIASSPREDKTVESVLASLRSMPENRLSPISAQPEGREGKQPEKSTTSPHKPIRLPEIKPVPAMSKASEPKGKGPLEDDSFAKFKMPQQPQPHARPAGATENAPLRQAPPAAPPPPSSPSSSSSSPEKAGGKKLPMAIAAALAVAILGGGIWYLQSGSKENIPADARNTATAARDASRPDAGAPQAAVENATAAATNGGAPEAQASAMDKQENAGGSVAALEEKEAIAPPKGEPIKNAFYDHAQEAGAQTCSLVFPLLGRGVTSGATYTLQSGWDKTAPDKRPIQAIAGLSYDQPELKGHGAAMVFAVPNGNHCEGTAVRVLPMQKPCSEVDQSRVPAGSTKQELSGVMAFNLARDNSQVILIPASDNMCIAVSVLRAGD